MSSRANATSSPAGRVPQAKPKTYNPNKKLFRLNRAGAFFRVRSAFEGVCLIGRAGGGKSSVLLQIAQGYAEAGMGMYFCGQKGDFVHTIESMLSAGGALNRTLIPRDGKGGINLWRVEAEMFGEGKGNAENIVDSMFTGVEVVTRNLGSGASDPFWISGGKTMGKAIVPLLMRVEKTIDIRRVRQVAWSLRSGFGHLEGDWSKNHALALCQQVMNDPEAMASYNIQSAVDYITQYCPSLASKTLSSIQATLDTVLEIWCRDEVYYAVCHDDPDFRWDLRDIRDKGLIVVCGYEIKAGHELTGVIIAAAMKRAIGKQAERELKEYPEDRRDELRPIAIVLDDAGQMLDTSDLSLFSTSRESRICPLISLHSVGLVADQFGGGAGALNKAQTTIGFMSTVFALSNQDEATNKYVSGKLGEKLVRREGGSKKESPTIPLKGRPEEKETKNYHYVREPVVPYWAMQGFKSGGLVNSGEIEAMLIMADKARGAEYRAMKIRIYQEPRYGFKPDGWLEWVQWIRFKWNHFCGRNMFLWLDSKPRLRSWCGHVKFRHVLGWLLVDQKRGKMLLHQWASFWMFDRTDAVYTEEEYAKAKLYSAS